MNIDSKTVAAHKAFVSQMVKTIADIKNDNFGIDGKGDTLTSVIGMVVETFGADTYTQAKSSMASASTEKSKIIALLESVIDQQNHVITLNEATLKNMAALGISGITFV